MRTEEQTDGDTKEEEETRDQNYLDVKYEESIEFKSEIGEEENHEITLDDISYQNREKSWIKTGKSGRDSQMLSLPRISRAATEFQSTENQET